MNKYSDNQWHQAVIRRTSNLLELYIDSNLIGANNQVSGTVGNNTHPFVLGYNLAAPYFDPYGFNGSIDDISFYKTSVPIRDLSLIAFYPFNNSFRSTNGLCGVNKGSSFPTDRFGNLNNA
ncbi:MAG: LamG-like jellyroll fold domain-containing protein, partial [Cytophagales bacterium]